MLAVADNAQLKATAADDAPHAGCPWPAQRVQSPGLLLRLQVVQINRQLFHRQTLCQLTSAAACCEARLAASLRCPASSSCLRKRMAAGVTSISSSAPTYLHSSKRPAKVSSVFGAEPAGALGYGWIATNHNPFMESVAAQLRRRKGGSTSQGCKD